ncbi:MAG: hypothetical protein E7191_02445 [Erysipelotrichaceae bacterium]|nr:hypothetical protein [Erysipelotrichaceae bacterium]
MRRLWLVVLSVLVLCGCTVTEKEAVFPPEISIETVDVDLFTELPNAEGITVFQDNVVVANNTDEGSEYYLVSMDGKEAELLVTFPGEKRDTDHVSTDTHLYLTTHETVLDDFLKVSKYVYRIYSCTLDSCEMIKEEIEVPVEWAISGPKYDLEVYNGDLYMMYTAGSTVGNKLFKYDEDSKEWTTVLEMENNVLEESLVANDKYLGLTYTAYYDGGYILYFNLLTENHLSVDSFDLPYDSYSDYSTFNVEPILYNDHIAIPVRRKNHRACNYLIHTDKYVEMENTVPCNFIPVMITEDMYISTFGDKSQTLNKITADKVESVKIDYENIKFTAFMNEFYVIDENTIINVANNDGKWHIIHLSQK